MCVNECTCLKLIMAQCAVFRECLSVALLEMQSVCTMLNTCV